jgi:hypothetical protein
MKAVNERLPVELADELDGSVACQMRQNRQMSGTTVKSPKSPPNLAGKP